LSSSNPIGYPFIELLSVESTNNYAMGLVRAAMAQHGTAVFAHDQTKGKGQRNRHWVSEPGQNIALSLILEADRLDPSRIFVLSMTIAVATSKFISRFVQEDVKIKWPNDIYWRDRKAAGILIENLWQGNQWKFAVAGIGVNVNQKVFGDLAAKAVSLTLLTGKTYDPLELAHTMCDDVNAVFNQLLSDPESVIKAYRQKLYRLHETVRLKKENRQFDAIIQDVSIDGRLMVQHSTEESFEVGEVEWMI
jgi:BirA family biotin operon repressor/biotin-[acetyl-CoA-carboxylase] ligase